MVGILLALITSIVSFAYGSLDHGPEASVVQKGNTSCGEYCVHESFSLIGIHRSPSEGADTGPRQIPNQTKSTEVNVENHKEVEELKKVEDEKIEEKENVGEKQLEYPHHPSKKYFVPEVDSFEATWTTWNGDIIQCNKSHCFTEFSWRPLLKDELGRTVLADTEWEALAMSDVCVRWRRSVDGKSLTQLWSRLPPTEDFLDFVKSETYWVDEVGYASRVIGQSLCFGPDIGVDRRPSYTDDDFDKCLPLTIEDGVISYRVGGTIGGGSWQEDFFVMDYYEDTSITGINNECLQTKLKSGNAGRRKVIRWRKYKTGDLPAFLSRDFYSTEMTGCQPEKSDVGEAAIQTFVNSMGNVFQCNAGRCSVMAPPEYTYPVDLEESKILKHWDTIDPEVTKYVGFKDPVEKPIVLEFYGDDTKTDLLGVMESLDFDGKKVSWWETSVKTVHNPVYLPSIVKFNVWFSLSRHAEEMMATLLSNSWFTSLGLQFSPGAEQYLVDDNGERLWVALRGRKLAGDKMGRILTVGPYVVVDIQDRVRGALHFKTVNLLELNDFDPESGFSIFMARRLFLVQAATETAGQAKGLKHEQHEHIASEEEKLAETTAAFVPLPDKFGESPGDPFPDEGEEDKENMQGEMVYGEDGEKKTGGFDWEYVVLACALGGLTLCALVFVFRWTVDGKRKRKKHHTKHDTSREGKRHTTSQGPA